MITNKTVDMRVEAAILTAENKQLRIEGRRTLRKARKQAAKQNSKSRLTYAQYHNLYLERMKCRQEARYHHLARMLLKGRTYTQVESTTHHNVCAERLFDTVWQWEPEANYNLVESWLQVD
jgi:hypothetical protein